MKRLKGYFLLSVAVLTVALFFGAYQPMLSADASLTVGTPSRTVIIDAGHGGMDAGAIAADGTEEKHLNLQYAETLAALLREAGVRVIMTRTEDALVLSAGDDVKGQRKKRDLANRLAVGEQNPDAIFVSIHMNSYPAEKYSGFQVYYSPNHPDSRRLATMMQDRVRQKLQPSNHRTVKAATSSIFLLHHLQSPAVLVECGFLSNEQEAAKLLQEDYRKELCFLLFCAIMEM